MEERDFYAILGVAKDADTQHIKEAFRQKAFEFHPDRNQGNDSSAARMKAINEAYAVLSNPDKRRSYDMLRQNYGNGAYERFRHTYSDQDIFKNSDLQQVFEELAKSFGLRGFDDIFKEYYGQRYKTFEFRQPGIFAKGFIYRGGGRTKIGGLAPKASLLGYLAQKFIQNVTGTQLPKAGADIHDVIDLKPEFALQGGPYAYFLRKRNKKLVVKIPAMVKNGQSIRLAGMGHEGVGGADNGNLYLKVKIRLPFIERVKSLISHGK